MGVDFLLVPFVKKSLRLGIHTPFLSCRGHGILRTHCHLNNRPNIPNSPDHFPTPFPSHRTVTPRYGISLNNHSNRNVNWKASKKPSLFASLPLPSKSYDSPKVYEVMISAVIHRYRWLSFRDCARELAEEKWRQRFSMCWVRRISRRRIVERER